MWSAKDVYYISDSTALLAEDIGRSLLCQFHNTSFREELIPFVRSVDDARDALARIRGRSAGRYPLLFCTIMDQKVLRVLDAPEVELFDLFAQFLDRLEFCLETDALRTPGFSRVADNKTVARRVEAIHFTLDHDDGTRVREYDEAEIILVGVSRSGKTPMSVYLATHMGFKTANYPLTSEDLNRYRLPQDIIRNRDKVVGLNILEDLLHQIREQRYPGSSYARLATCSQELEQARQIYLANRIPTVETGNRSIEEVSAQIIHTLHLKKHKH